MTRNALSVAHWAAHLGHPVDSLEHWIDLVTIQMEEAAAQDMDILIMPEYISEFWMYFAPENIKATDEMAWCATLSAEAIARLQECVKDTNVALVAGSMPWKDNDRIVNRAWMLFPDRKPVYHDKLVLTPFEKKPDDWFLYPGNTLKVFNWHGFNMTILICLDIEMPALSCLLSYHDIDLILVPSITELPSGYHRVFSCAKARAIEMMCAVSVVGGVGGSIKQGQPRDHYHSGAAVYVPCEKVFGYTGTFADMPLHDVHDKEGDLLYVKDIPLGEIRKRRHSHPEVWPGPWQADHIKIENV